MDRKAPDVTGADIGAEIARIHPLIMRELARRQSPLMMRETLTLPQVLILDVLTERVACKMTDLAKVLNLTLSAVTIIIDKMVRQKLVKRSRSREDRRVVNVVISKKGTNIISRISARRQNIIASAFSALSEEEKGEYLKLLRKVYESVRKNEGTT